jgi:hypothetical protein
MQNPVTNKHSVALVDSTSHRGEVEKALMSFYDVTPFDDGKDALKKLSKHPPGIIIVGEDVSPGGSLNFIRAVRGERTLTRSSDPLYHRQEKFQPDRRWQGGGHQRFHHQTVPPQRNHQIHLAPAERQHRT